MHTAVSDILTIPNRAPAPLTLVCLGPGLSSCLEDGVAHLRSTYQTLQLDEQ